jgi:hypothetical protein
MTANDLQTLLIANHGSRDIPRLKRLHKLLIRTEYGATEVAALEQIISRLQGDGGNNT